MDWFLLIIAGLLEIVWAVNLKYSDGFSNTNPTIITIVASLSSFYVLAIAMKTIPISTAYAAWTGIGICGTVIYGMFFFNESRDLIKICCILAILGSIATLKFIAK